MKTRQQDSDLSDESGTFLDRIKDHPYFQWLTENKTFIPYAFAGIVVVLFLAFRFVSGQTVHNESNYLLAERTLAELRSAIASGSWEEKSSQQLQELDRLVSSHQELQARYDAPLAQLLILRGEAQEAKAPADRTIMRAAKNSIPFIHSFAETTLDLSRKNDAQALEKTKALKGEMIAQNAAPSFSSLFAYNLLRIAMLEQSAGTKQGELQAWNEWKSYANGDDASIAASIKQLNEQLREGNFALDQYIALREAVLKE